MKKKELKKKLSFKKETVSALTKKESSKIKGGATLGGVCGVTKTMLWIGDICGVPCHEQ